MSVTDSMEGTYEAVGGAMKFCQLMQFLEVMHPLFGYTKGGVLTPLIQVTVNGTVMLQVHDLLKSFEIRLLKQNYNRYRT
jgi:very-long-chain (3R)-3-hydroxyacyl-CoA dehydratase